MRRFLIINNIPTPYRTFMFQQLYEVGLRRGIETTVAFQARREARRHWNPDEFEMQFPHYYSSGMRFWTREPREFFTYPTLNFDILKQLGGGEFDFVLLAALNSVNGWLASWIPAGKTRKVLWSESNLLSTRYMSGAARSLKSAIISGVHALACPGERALEYLFALRPQTRHLPQLYLPNLVDTALFERRVAELRGQRRAIREAIGAKEGRRLILGVGRMVDYKGFGQVVEAAARVPGDYQILLLGDGERLEQWRARTRALGIEARVRFEGQKPEAEVVRALAAADWFLHPALEDPSPLVTIEAATAGLPLAVAEQTGNSPETVIPEQSGFRFDAGRIDAVADTLRKMVEMTEAQRVEFGARSAALSREKFSPEPVINRFFDDLLKL